MSPYENRLHTENFRRIGLFAQVKSGHETTVSTLTSEEPSTEFREAWQAAGLTNVVVSSLATDNGLLLFTYLEYHGVSAEEAAANVSQAPWFRNLADHIVPHPRTATGACWMPMETINIIGPTVPLPPSPNPVQKIGMVTQLEPSTELTYRTLHQTNWPGVVDQMTRSNRRYWVTFLIELGEALWLFTYTEYIGENMAADNAAMAKDPVTQRWWKHTQPCLKPISDEPGSWTTMRPLA
mgnify:CR=1 FL=1